MSFIERNETVDQLFDPKSSDSEDNCQSNEEVNSEESFMGSLTNFKNIVIDNNQMGSSTKRNSTKNQRYSLPVSLRYGKFNRQKSKISSRKIAKKKKKCQKSAEKIMICLEKPAEIPKKGKRCRLGGKAKGNPPEEEGSDKRDSDDDSDNLYFGRISLGYFQKFKDNSGASTSSQWEEDSKSAVSLCNEENMIHNMISEEMELQELQQWGKTALVSPYNRKTDDPESDFNIKSDRL